MIQEVTPLFKLGQIVATPGALELLEQFGQQPGVYLKRHVTGDWGDIDPEDKGLNEQAIKDGLRIMSVYHLAPKKTIGIITEADRSVTTLLLPEEY